MKICLFDPSLRSNNGDPSINLGDLIIHESVEKYLNEVFPGSEIHRISSHVEPDRAQLGLINKHSFIFFGGTNALSSDLKEYNQWKLSVPPKPFWPISFPVSNVILMGVGWWQYQKKPTAYSRSFYKRALSNNFIHSVRDSYTLKKMNEMGFKNVVNTCCPTMWQLDGYDVSCRKKTTENCIFTLTDYSRSPDTDNQIIKIILDNYRGRVFFFPQGSEDIEYISSLNNFQLSSDRITIVNRTFEDFVFVLNSNDIDYIGTRLHAGIKCLQLSKNTLILAVDNRATEISNDSGLPVIDRSNLSKLKQWIDGDKLFGKIVVPLKEIDCWKKQFSCLQSWDI